MPITVRGLHAPNLLALLMLRVGLSVGEPRVAVIAAERLTVPSTAAVMKSGRTRNTLLLTVTLHLHIPMTKLESVKEAAAVVDVGSVVVPRDVDRRHIDRRRVDVSRRDIGIVGRDRHTAGE